ncbi:MAG: type II toxin-antitoxin system RelE/ParE family toxin [Candidatus Hydrogenedentes bacterium]|nr:type II toxin-antitoxin system RelE/ParE family toxin [Candidatus Hydrogenedentota bacterium]
MRVIIHRLARRDFVRAMEYYKKRSRVAVPGWIEELDAGIDLIRQFPGGMPEMEPGVRRLILKRYPYCLIYTLQDNTAVIVAVVHQRRKRRYWKRRLSES